MCIDIKVVNFSQYLLGFVRVLRRNYWNIEKHALIAYNHRNVFSNYYALKKSIRKIIENFYKILSWLIERSHVYRSKSLETFL